MSSRKFAKTLFLESEGNAWFERNREKRKNFVYPDDDRILLEILNLQNLPEQANILEVGCAGGERLSWLESSKQYKCQGIEPSSNAVLSACSSGADVVQGTADSLPFEDESFDVLIFGFCLYLCDRTDLFKIAFEADRVLKAPGWIIIEDFFSEKPKSNPYHHYEGLTSFKMDYRRLFTWHPWYTCTKHEICKNGEFTFTDESNEWMSVSLIRKCQNP